MKEFAYYLQTEKASIEKAIIAHLQLVSIHPFIDGNGRTARLLMNLLLLKDGKPPLVIRPRDRKRYLQVIEKAQLTEERTDYMSFMYKALERSFDTYIEMFNKDKSDVQHNKLMKISEFAKACGVPVSTIRYYLRAGKIKPVAKTAGDYMLFSGEQVKEIFPFKK
jgi:Fic family protein